MTWVLILIQVIAVGLFLILIWPHLRKEEWKKKFIEDKHARSMLIVFLMIFLLSAAMGIFFEIFFPVERID